MAETLTTPTPDNLPSARTCPQCGYCPACGRSGGGFVVPQYPWGGQYPQPQPPFLTYPTYPQLQYTFLTLPQVTNG